MSEVEALLEPTHPYPAQDGSFARSPPGRGALPGPLLGGVGVGSESPCAREVWGGLSPCEERSFGPSSFGDTPEVRLKKLILFALRKADEISFFHGPNLGFLPPLER